MTLCLVRTHRKRLTLFAYLKDEQFRGLGLAQIPKMSKFLLHLFAAFAEMERGLIRERVRALDVPMSTVIDACGSENPRLD